MIKTAGFVLVLTLIFIGASASEYKNSACYQAFKKTYDDAVKRSIAQMEGRLRFQARTGLVLNSPPASEEGNSEKSIINAADLELSYDENQIESRRSLNDFHYIHSKVMKKFPGTSESETRAHIRKGFDSGDFCKKFWLIGGHYNKKDVSKYVIETIRDELEASANVEVFINDSEGLEKSNAPGSAREAETQGDAKVLAD